MSVCHFEVWTEGFGRTLLCGTLDDGGTWTFMFFYFAGEVN